MSRGFIEWLLLSQELLGDDCGGFHCWEGWDLSPGAGEAVALLQNNFLDSGHIPHELGYGSLLGSQRFAFCLKKNSLKRSFPLRSYSAGRSSRRMKHTKNDKNVFIQ